MGGVTVLGQALCDAVATGGGCVDRVAAVLRVGTASSVLTAHSGPFGGRRRAENLSCESLLIRFTLALGLRLLMKASSSALLAFVRADLSQGNFFTRYPAR